MNFKDLLARHAVTAAFVSGALLIGFLIGGLLTRPAPPTIEIRTKEPQPSPTVILIIHVEGGVATPGVYRLAGDARVFEAIDAAGGAVEDAEVSGLNLAARVTDGQKIFVPVRGRPQDPAVANAPGANPTPATASAATGGRINVNTANQRTLESLPGIGPVTAQRILAYRASNGPFTQIDQLRSAGVPAATLERIRNLVSID